ncbi:unnamed protein product [Didymodactylos carnosus]|uniref:Retrotransposon gag domain-containing protein n=1 Tax=Didymodactylos carnosus TaxID=1234261 RepID=A0A8S2D4J9_9BILA|nr:unnamed protein product [Didymodactylos carnosus]CAF3626967.1 unnamed protein product [Didymodactylos carnosus]
MSISDNIKKFAGTTKEALRRFILEYQQKAKSAYGWDNETILNSISHWLTDAAAEWYQQLIQSNELPKSWNAFAKLLARFSSPERKEALKIQRNQCRQGPNESVADFYQRYKGLALEIDPRISELQLRKHLFRKLRSEVITLMGVEADELSIPRMMKRAEKVELLLLHQRKDAQQEGMFESSTVITSVRDPGQQEIITTKKKFIRPDPTTVAVIESIQTSSQSNSLNNSNNNNNNSNMNKRDQGWWRREHDDRNI